MDTIRANAARLAWTKYLDAVEWRRMCEARARHEVARATWAESAALSRYDRIASD